MSNNNSGYIYGAGLPPKQVNTLNYTGTPLSTVPVVNVPRAPTVNDGQFPLFTLWRNSNAAATLPDAEGDLWYYAKTDTSVYPVQYVWNKIATGTTPGGTMIGLTDTALTSVLPNGAGFIQLLAGAGVTVTSDPANNRLTIALSGGGPAVDQFTTDSGVVTPDGTGNVNLFGQNVAGSGIQVTGAGSTASHRMISPYSLGAFLFDGGNVSVSRSASGAQVQFTTSNTSNTASSDARHIIQVAGASAGNAWTDWTISGVQAYAAGIDNADDSWKLTNSNTFTGAGSTLIRATNAGNVSVLAGDFDVTRAANGTTVQSVVGNTGTTTANSQLVSYVGATSTGDASWKVAIAATRAFCGGIDNSDSDSYKVNTDASSDVEPSTGTNLYKLTTAGQPSYPAAGWTNAGVLYSGSAGEILATTAGIAGQVLTSNGPGVAPTYQGALTSWTPVLNFGGLTTGITYSAQVGNYYRIGNVVFFSGAFTLTNKGVATGFATITGLPFTGGGVDVAVNVTNLALDAGCTGTYGTITAPTPTIILGQTNATGTGGQLDDVNFANNSSVGITGFYFII